MVLERFMRTIEPLVLVSSSLVNFEVVMQRLVAENLPSVGVELFDAPGALLLASRSGFARRFHSSMLNSI